MTRELPEGTHDSVANARVARLHSEVQRLARSSPPVAGREAKIRELKAAVAILRDYQFGFTSVRWLFSIYQEMAAGLVITSGALFLLRIVVSGPRNLPTAVEAIRGGSYVVMALVAVGAWDFLRTRRRLRMAEALADSLAGQRTPGFGIREEAGHEQEGTEV